MTKLTVSALILALGTTLMAAPQSTTPSAPAATKAAPKHKVLKKVHVKKANKNATAPTHK